MNVQSLSPEFAATGQITPDQLPEIAAAGFKSIICNRPDEESPGQPAFSEVARAAEQAGLQARHLPVVSGQVSDAHGVAMAQLLRELPAPVLAYCRSGARSTGLWQLAQGR